MQLIPELWSGRLIKKLRLEFVPAVRGGSTFGTHATGQHIKKMQAPRNTPSAQVAAGSSTPIMSRKSLACSADLACDLHNPFCRHAAFLLRDFGSVFGVFFDHLFDVSFEGQRSIRMAGFQVRFPVGPIF